MAHPSDLHIRSPSPPSQTFHPSILPLAVPTPAMLESVAGAAHYSSVNIEPDSLSTTMRRRDCQRRLSHSEVSADHQDVINDLSELFCCQPTLECLVRRWRRDAIFEDPLTHCEGLDECAAQWFGLPQVCPKSETLEQRVMSSTLSPNRVVYFQKQTYTMRFFGYKKTIESIVTVDLDDEDKIVKLVDRWDGKELPTRFGAYFLRRLNAKLVPWLVSVPKI